MEWTSLTSSMRNSGTLLWGAGALAGGFKLLRFFQGFLNGPTAKYITQKVLLSIQQIDSAAAHMVSNESWEQRKASLPDFPGVYVIITEAKERYVGLARNLKQRLTTEEPWFKQHKN